MPQTVNELMQPLLQRIEQHMQQLCRENATLEEKCAFISVIASVNNQGMMTSPHGLKHPIEEIRSLCLQTFNQARPTERQRMIEIQQQFVATLLVKGDIVQTPFFQQNMKNPPQFHHDDDIHWQAILPAAIAGGLLNSADDMVDNMLWNLVIFGRPSIFHPLTLYLFGARPGNMVSMDEANTKACAYMFLALAALYSVVASGMLVYAGGKHGLNIARGKDPRENAFALTAMTVGIGVGAVAAWPAFTAIAASTVLAVEVGALFPPVLGVVVGIAIAVTIGLALGWLASGAVRAMRNAKQNRQLNHYYHDPNAKHEARMLINALENEKDAPQNKGRRQQREIQRDINAVLHGRMRYYSLHGHIIELKPNILSVAWPYQTRDNLADYPSYHDINTSLLYPPIAGQGHAAEYSPALADNYHYGAIAIPMRRPPPMNPELLDPPPGYDAVHAPAAANEHTHLLGHQQGY